MVSSVDAFKEASVKEMTLDGGLTIRVKQPSLLAIAKRGKVPNALMAQVGTMFGEKPSEINTNSLVNDNFTDLVELIDVMCEASIVEPKYEEIKDYLTDVQKFQIFSFTQGEVNDVAPSTGTEGNSIDNSDGSTIQG